MSILDMAASLTSHPSAKYGAQAANSFRACRNSRAARRGIAGDEVLHLLGNKLRIWPNRLCCAFCHFIDFLQPFLYLVLIGATFFRWDADWRFVLLWTFGAVKRAPPPRPAGGGRWPRRVSLERPGSGRSAGVVGGPARGAQRHGALCAKGGGKP